MKCMAVRSMAILLFALTNGALTERISANNYLSLITDVHKYYRTSCIVFVHYGNYEDLNVTTLLHTWSREFSRRGVMTMTLTFLDLVSEYNEYRKIVRPLFVVLLDSEQSMSEFATATASVQPISYPIWFVMFLQRPGDPLRAYCSHPTDNAFNVDFSTMMLVLCYDRPILAEWYAMRDNRTRTFELATWSPDKGLTLMTRKSLYARRNNLFGDVLRVASIHDSQYIFIKNGVVSGFLGSLLVELSRVMNFTIQFLDKMESYGNWNRHEKTWTGVIGKLVADKADLGAGEFSVTPSRLDIVDFTLPLIHSRSCLYIKQPDASDVQWSGYWRTFNREVWIGIVLIIMVTPILLGFMKTKGYWSTNLILENYIYVWGIYCQQGLSEFPKESSMRLAFLSIFVSSLLISAVYSASFISFLTLTTVSLPFSTLEGYIEDGSYKLIVLKNSAEYDIFYHAKDPLLLKMNQSMKETLPLTQLEGFKQVCKEKVAFYTTEVLKNAIPILCNIEFIDTGNIDNMALILQRGSPYTGIINYNIRQFLDTGIMNRLKEKHILTSDPSETVRDAVSLGGIAPILTPLVGGMVLSIFILILEKVYCYIFNIRCKNAKSFVRKLNLGMKLQKKNSRKNLELRFNNMNYTRPIGYWP